MSRAVSYNSNGHNINKFQIRIKEPLGHVECPYAYRWVFITPFLILEYITF